MGELEGIINRATNPNNVYEDWKSNVALCDYLNRDASAIPNAVRLLSHKMQSPQEKEAIYALRTLEACVQRCGAKFHTEIGKFRFLNEMIKMLSPKYLGARTPETVKRRVTEVLKTWTVQLKSETKIAEAYAMLQRNGFIRDLPPEDTKAAANRAVGDSQAGKKKAPSVFEDNEKSKTLAALLKSRNPADLIAANRLIKTMLKEDSEKQDRLIKRDVELETVANNVKLLVEMLNSFEAEPGRSHASELEIVRELQTTLQRARPQLVKLAAETDERDTETVALICKLGDDVSNALTRCSNVLGTQLLDNIDLNAPAASAPSASATDALSSLDADLRSLAVSGPVSHTDVSLLDLDFGFSSPATMQPAAAASSSLNGVSAKPISPDTNTLLTDIFRDVASAPPPVANLMDVSSGVSTSVNVSVTGSNFVPPPRAGGYTSLTTLKTGVAAPVAQLTFAAPSASPFAELELLQKNTLSKSQTANEPQFAQAGNSLLDLGFDEPAASAAPVAAAQTRVVTETLYTEFAEHSGASSLPCSTSELLPVLKLNVSDVLPDSQTPKVLLDCESVRLMLHFTANRPEPSGSRLLVLALSSYNTSRVSNVQLHCATLVRCEHHQLLSDSTSSSESVCTFQCAAFRLVAMSDARELAAFNPLVPPATITFALHVARASDSRCPACQRDSDAFARCVKLRVAFDLQCKTVEQLVNLADFV